LLSDSSKSSYYASGGKDTLGFNRIGSSDKIYIGYNKIFWSTVFRGQLVYFPEGFSGKIANVGFNLSGEWFTGTYNSLNGKFGIPIRFNDNKGDPTVNIELQLKSQDLFNKAFPNKAFWEKASFGISIGLPFNSLIY
jgi:hypothetical protein